MSQGYGVSDSYTFGQPRVGNRAFVSALNFLLGSRARIHRVTHSMDPVPHLPFMFMGFRHLAFEIYYDGATTDGYTVCDGSGEDWTCSNQWHDFARLLGDCIIAESFNNGTRCDHMTYMTGALPFAMGPDSCLDAGGLYVTDGQSAIA